MIWLKKSLLFRFFCAIVTLYKLSALNRMFTAIGDCYRASGFCRMLSNYIYREPYFESSRLKIVLEKIWAFLHSLADRLYPKIEGPVAESFIAGFLYGNFVEIKNNWIQSGFLWVGSFGLVYSFLALVRGRHSIKWIAAGLCISALCCILSTVKKEKLLDVITGSFVVRFFLYLVQG